MINNNDYRLVVFAISQAKNRETVFAQLYRKSKTWTLPNELLKPKQTMLEGIKNLLKEVEFSEVQKAEIIYDSEILYTKDIVRTILCEVTVSRKIPIYREIPKNLLMDYQGFVPITQLWALKNRTELMKLYLRKRINKI